MKKSSKLAVIILTVSLCLYIGIYAILSAKGQYEPAVIGLGHVKAWAWTPAGFSNSNGQLRPAPCIFFFPLYILDMKYWHTEEDSPGWQKL